jgi:hypothetical protein
MAVDSFGCYWATGTAPTAANGYEQSVVDSTSTTQIDSLAGFEFAECLKLASTTNFLNGTDLTSSNSFLEMNIINAPTNLQYVNFICKADILFIIMGDGSIEVRV